MSAADHMPKACGMKLRKVSGCEDKTCPGVYVSDRGTTVVQGTHVPTAEGLEFGDGETAVELPTGVVLGAVSALVECAGISEDELRRLREAVK
ncbi:hypothetical protein [Saccharopolyspora mangrovi]|uniref:Uncharacterized protein n=1 Tax=Saccharopolyspora mangrovi TaxID=3082379 RepID=A0ABU6AJC3_9PSEU|nr:hypothetical protein [Saccharopolyspora sp. S2-29]MEB3371533.1 hypothetical protein [Saccharopolyspora sp. S2-29]